MGSLAYRFLIFDQKLKKHRAFERRSIILVAIWVGS